MSMTGRPSHKWALILWPVALSLLATTQASSQAPRAAPTARPATPPVAATASAAKAAASTPTPSTLPPRTTPAAKPSPAARAIQTANAAARTDPTDARYVNSTLFYDFEPGRLYELRTSPDFLTAIMLRPGEKLVAKAAGDTVRWVLGETVQGAGLNQQVVVLVKPMRGGLRTNLVLTTDQRSYLIEVMSGEGKTYTSAVSWNYPQEEMQELAARQAQQAALQAVVAAKTAAVQVSPGLSIDQLNFSYQVKPVRGKPPRWQPLRVFDDGTKTYIQFPVNMASTEAPPLFLIGPGNSAELVNYRYINGYYVVDQLIDIAELRIGEKPQTAVRITRTGERS